MTPKIAHFLDSVRPATPCLVVDLDRVEDNFRALRRALPRARIFYAIKANPAPAILRRLVGLESDFDAASFEEVQACLDAGATPERISYGNTIKKVSAIIGAYQAGVRLFAFDAEEELRKLARHAPGSRVYCRLLVENDGADWPLSRKFGTTVEEACRLLVLARELGLDPFGVSFHVGSQQTSAHGYDAAIAKAAMLFTDLRERGVELRMLNLGGGFPTAYRPGVPGVADFGEAIMQAMVKAFGNRLPDMIVEPGRYMAGDAGVVQAEVVLASHRGLDTHRWVYLDIGRFGGLAETEGEAIKYRIRTPHDGTATEEVVIAGPSCDGVDILYEKKRYHLPKALECGDKVELLDTGAYVSTYASQSFNGFLPLQEYYI